MPPTSIVDPGLLRALSSPAMYRGHPAVAVHETHASWVFVASKRAYKIKKPVAMGFLDYSTLGLRRAACREEVRVNARLAPGIYLGVLAIVPAGDGFRFAPEPDPEAIEYSVEMVSFREQDTLAGLIAADQLTAADIGAVARCLADFHRDATQVEDWGADRVLARWGQNLSELAATEHPADWRLDTVKAFGESFVASHALEINERASDGLARDGHGDLRCEHVLMRPSLRVVDRIEFDPRLRQGDVASDTAFLAMDLEASGQRWAADELVAAYGRAGMDPGGEALRACYAAHWALVRAKVLLISAAARSPHGNEQQLRRAVDLWSLCERLCWRARAPVAIVVCGAAASGKSTLALELSRRSEITVVSSDKVRKRLAGLGPGERAREEHYSRSFTIATYRQVARDAVLILGQGHSVIVDATCKARFERRLLLDALAGTRATRLLVHCRVPLAVAVERATQRLCDPERVSDASPGIVTAQYAAFEQFEEPSDGPILKLDALQPLAQQIVSVTGSVDRLMKERRPAVA